MAEGSWGGRQCPPCELQPRPGLSLPDAPAWAPALGPSTFDHLPRGLPERRVFPRLLLFPSLQCLLEPDHSEAVGASVPKTEN